MQKSSCELGEKIGKGGQCTLANDENSDLIALFVAVLCMRTFYASLAVQNPSIRI